MRNTSENVISAGSIRVTKRKILHKIELIQRKEEKIMRAAGSPFQAKSSQEQKEQWIWWQQYDAIMQRMKVAQGRTGAFTSCGTSTQDSSGK